MKWSLSAALFLIVLVLCGGAHAAETTSILPGVTFRVMAHDNMHTTGEGGKGWSADDWHRSQVTLTQRGGGKVTIEDRGESGESSASMGGVGGYQAKVTRWTTTWGGAWTPRRGGANVKVALEQRRCETTETQLGTETKTPCPEGPRELRLTCKPVRIQLDRDYPDTPRTDARPAAWNCAAANRDASSFETPMPWVFGKNACIEARFSQRPRGLTSHTGRTMVLCEDEPIQ